MDKYIKTYLVLLIGLGGLAALASCTGSPAKYVSKNHEKLNQTISQLNALGEKVYNQTIDSDKLALPDDAPVLDLNDVGSYAWVGMSNVQLFTIQDLLDPSGEVSAMHLFAPRAKWQTVQAMVKESQFPKTKEDAFKALNSFSRWRYAVVVRPRSFSEPQIASAPRETNTTDRETYS